MTHSFSPAAGQSPAVGAIKEAIGGLGPEYAEVKEYERKVIEGAEEAATQSNKSRGNTDMRNDLIETGAVTAEAQRFYNSGDKAGAYRALGHYLYNELPGDLKQGAVTVMLPTTVIPKIQETAGGFYLLLNRPLTAQLPGGDGGNHKDRPETGIKESTDTTGQEYIETIGGNAEGRDVEEVRFVSGKTGETKSIKSAARIKKQDKKWLYETTKIREVKKGQGLALVERTSQLEKYDVIAYNEKCRKQEKYTEECADRRETAYPGEYWDKELELLNVKGETIFKKQFRVWPGEDLSFLTYWENGFSRDNRSFFVYHRDEKGGGNVDVYDVAGKLLAHGRAERDIEKIEISPDGSLVAGYVVNYGEEGEPKFIYVLDVATGRSKLAKASGEMSGKKWGASFIFFNPNPKIPSGKLNIYVGIRKDFPEQKGLSWDGYLSFLEIPEDLENLLGKAATWRDSIPSGVYYYSIVAERGGQKIRKAGKFAVVR